MYNVFKRPMFKRGGPTKGTGIMSHVEPRVRAANGFPSFQASPMNPSQVDAFRQLEADRLAKIKANRFSGILGPRFTDPSFTSPFSDFFTNRTGFEVLKPGGILNEEIITANLKAPQAKSPRAMGADAEIDKEIVKTITEDPLKPEIKINKENPKYVESDIESEVTKESKLLKRLLKDEDYSKGELALVIAGALKEPGGIAAKLDKARELSLPIARKRREEDKAITLAAYKAAKEKEKYETRYGQDSDTIRFYKERARSLVGTPGYQNKTEDQIYKELMSGSAEARVNILKSPQTAGEVSKVTDRIARLTTESKTAKPKRKEQIVDEILQQKSQLDFLIKMPEFESIYPGVKESLGYKYGGRVMKAIGGDVSEEDTDMQASDNTVGMAIEKIGEGSGSQTVSEPVQRLSYQELRDRLPQEITDDVVSLLANSEEALQEFAYIRTQDDVNSFNTKYGVNLVIPPTRG